MAKRDRENALRERRLRKQAKKEARKRAAADPQAAATENEQSGPEGEVA